LNPILASRNGPLDDAWLEWSFGFDPALRRKRCKRRLSRAQKTDARRRTS
jgi:hypothetical protein